MQKSTLYLIYFICCLALLQSSCGILSEQGPEAAFIEIPSLSFSHSGGEGPADHNIEHVEIFFEEFSIGYYEIPVKLAVIPTMDESRLVIRPAIRENGQANAITAYVMMENFELTQNFQINETYSIIPEFKYQSNIIFDFVETFETGNALEFDLDEIDTSFIERSTLDQYSGAYSGLMSGENAESIKSASDFIFTDLDNNGRDVVVEFRYKNDENLIFGLVAFRTGFPNQEIPLINLVQRNEWNKLYLNVTPIILNNPAEGYRLYFESDISSLSSKIFIDNVKLLHIP